MLALRAPFVEHARDRSQELDALLDRFDFNGSSKIEFNEFEALKTALERSVQKSSSGGASGESKEPSSSSPVSDPQKKITLLDAFEAFDRNGAFPACACVSACSALSDCCSCSLSTCGAELWL